MALTKVRAIVADISLLSNGTTQIDIPSAGGDVDIDIGGAAAVDISATEFTIDDALTLIANLMTGENITLATGAGATVVLKTTGTEASLITSSAHALDLGANSVTGLTVETDGKVTLPVAGTASDQVMDKAYIDAGDVAAGQATVTATADGSATIPGDTDLIIKWGTATGTGDRTETFGVAFPNAIFTVVATPQSTGSATSDGWNGVESIATTGFNWNTANRGSYTGAVGWIAIGY
jgi:hypothetical protein